MKGKILGIFLAFVVALPIFTSVFAISYNDLLDRLDSVEQDIKDIKDEYEQAIEEYAHVISTLSEESQSTIEDLAVGLILEEGMTDRINELKAELVASTEPDAKDFLSATEGIEDAFKAMIEDNKDIVEEVKANYSELTVDQIKEVVEKTTEIIESLGAETDVTDTYDEMMAILNDAHKKAKDINTKLKDIISGNVSTFESALTLDLVKDLLDEVKAKDKNAVIDTLIEAVEGTEGGATLKKDLKEVKTMAAALKDKLMELDTLSEQDLLMFTDAQKKDVSDKLKLVEKDYIDFAKVILDSYSQDYMEVVINLAYDETVDTMIDYANKALDYYAKYKDTIASLTAKDVIERLDLPEELIEKAGLMVALGFVDTTNYNKEYVKETFATQIEDMSEYIAQEFVDYLDHIDSTINDEVMYKYLSGDAADKVQNDLRTITGSRFTTLTNLKALKARVDTEILASREDIKEDLTKLADYVYTMYNENILTSMIATIMKENDQEDKRYEADGEESCIITNKFMSSSDFTAELGIPKAHEIIVTYAELTNSKIKTGSTFNVKLSETSILYGTFAVLGDVFADGMVDARDYMIIKNHIMDGEKISAISLIAADTYRDDTVDSRDYMVIKNFIMDHVEIAL